MNRPRPTVNLKTTKSGPTADGPLDGPDEMQGLGGRPVSPLPSNACGPWINLVTGTDSADETIARTLPMLVLPDTTDTGDKTWVWSDLHVGHQNIIQAREPAVPQREGNGTMPCTATGRRRSAPLTA